MASRLYLREDGSVSITPAVDGTWNATASPFLRQELANAPTAGDTLVNISALSTVGAVRCYRQYISLPMQAGHTFDTSVTYKCYAQARESAADDNLFSRLGVRIVSEDGLTVRHTVLAVADYSTATEWNTALRAKAFADGDAGVGSYTTVAGDRLVVEIGHADAAGASITGTLRLGSEATGVTDLLENETALAGTLRPWFETSLTLTFKAAVAGSVAGSSTVTGNLTARGALAASAAGTSTVTGNLTARGALAASIACTSTANGNLTARGALSGSSAGTSTVTGNLTAAASGSISGSVAGTSAVSGNLTAKGQIAGTASGTSTVSGGLQAKGRLAGTASGACSVSGGLQAKGRLAGTASGSCSVTGALSAKGRLAGSAVGSCAVSGDLSEHSDSALSGSVAGTSTVTGNLTARGYLSGSAAGTSTVTGRLTDASAVTTRRPSPGATGTSWVTRSRSVTGKALVLGSVAIAPVAEALIVGVPAIAMVGVGPAPQLERVIESEPVIAAPEPEPVVEPEPEVPQAEAVSAPIALVVDLPTKRRKRQPLVVAKAPQPKRSAIAERLRRTALEACVAGFADVEREVGEAPPAELVAEVAAVAVELAASETRVIQAELLAAQSELVAALAEEALLGTVGKFAEVAAERVGRRVEEAAARVKASAYGAGRAAAASAPAVLKRRPFWRLAGNCAEHAQIAGAVMRASDPVWVDEGVPPWGARCSCYVEPVTASAAIGVRRADLARVLRR